MMRLKVAPDDSQSMSQDGDAILRSLQNKSLPNIDLLVRESLQNSLDATLSDSGITKVDFYINEFLSENLAYFFESIEEVLLAKYPGERTFLAVSDKNTQGLTGNYKSNDKKELDKSNFQKLVFGIGKNQEQTNAGGSWGLGKTSYFRIGVGLVIYYTRIKIENTYEERLIASLIESPKGKDRLLEKSGRGIAWWGEFDSTEKKIYPIIDTNEIKDILQVFGLSNYQDNETGTTIIIPYLEKIESENAEDEGFEKYPWEFNREDLIKKAVQRWYSPRILNDVYSEFSGNSQLDCYVNGSRIGPGPMMEPVFNIFQKLYTSALTGEPQETNITVKEIKFGQRIMASKEEIVGNVAYCEASRDDLKMTAPNNKPSGLAYIGVRDKEKIEKNVSKVMAYARKPGMIVEYSVDGKWFPSGGIQEDDHLLLAFFVPNSEGTLMEKYSERGFETLETYLRASENADHANWVDEEGIGIISRMKKFSTKAIQESFQDYSRIENTFATSGLSRKFGKLLMPPKNFGKTSVIQGNDNTNRRRSAPKNRLSDITVIKSLPIDEYSTKVIFKIFIRKNSVNQVQLKVLTQEEKLDKDAWENSIGNNLSFPFLIKDIFLEKINGKVINKNAVGYFDSNVEIKMGIQSPEYFEVTSKQSEELELEGYILLKVLSNQYIPVMVIRSEEKMIEGEN